MVKAAISLIDSVLMYSDNNGDKGPEKLNATQIDNAHASKDKTSLTNPLTTLIIADNAMIPIMT